jgi:hypothetical protein
MPNSADRSSRSNSKKPYQPAVGTEIEIDEVPTIEAKTRGFLARFIAISVGIAVAVTGAYGLVTGQYAAIEVVWAIAGPLVGAVVAHYFGVHRRDSG